MRSECGDLEEVERVSLEERIDARLAIAAISGVSRPLVGVASQEAMETT